MVRDQWVERIGVSRSCEATGVPRSSYYRLLDSGGSAGSLGSVTMAQGAANYACRVPGRALSPGERQHVADVLHEEAFKDEPVRQVWATLLDAGTYLCSISTMYRVLRSLGETTERRRHKEHVPAQRPELLATSPNQVWSWDITRLKGPVKWCYYYLYVILDIYSRYVVGWMIAQHEDGGLAKVLIEETIARECVVPSGLTIHSDRGSPMKSKSVTDLLLDLNVKRSLSRPRTSNDNPFSESHFKTMKYRPDVPERFGSAEQAREVFRELFVWYNERHHHSGLGLMTPEAVYRGWSDELQQKRLGVLHGAHSLHPTRFMRGAPHGLVVPNQVWINPPAAGRISHEDCDRDANVSALLDRDGIVT